jgi:hypothetical protein
MSMRHATPVVKSQSLTVISSDPDARVWPSGENATAQTIFEWPMSVQRVTPVVESQSLIILSSDPDARVSPSGENATALTSSEWPSSVLLVTPVVEPKSLALPSRDPDASVVSSGRMLIVFCTGWSMFGAFLVDAGFTKIFDLRLVTVAVLQRADVSVVGYSWKGIFCFVVGVDLKTTLVSLAKLQNNEIILMVKRDTFAFR